MNGRIPAPFQYVLPDGAWKSRKQSALGDACGAARRREFAFIEIAFCPRVEVKQEIRVDPFEIKHHGDSFAKTHIAEYFLAEVEDETLHANRPAGMQ